MRPRILVIGYGAIGRPLVKALLADGRFDLTVWSASLVDDEDAIPLVDSVDSAYAYSPDLVVECAGQDAVRTLIPPLLAHGLSCVIVSVGAFADPQVLEVIKKAADNRSRFIVPSGAIGGMDYLNAVKDDPTLEVEYISRKPVHVWERELQSRGIRAADMTGPFTVFSGTASEAALAYPKNLNVAATLAMNSIGMERTRVTVLADPAVSRNTHEITVRGQAGSAYFRFENVASAENPNTSAITQKSLLSEVQRYFRDLDGRSGQTTEVSNDH